jgi:hypothetical protein
MHERTRPAEEQRLEVEQNQVSVVNSIMAAKAQIKEERESLDTAIEAHRKATSGPVAIALQQLPLLKRKITTLEDDLRAAAARNNELEKLLEANGINTFRTTYAGNPTPISNPPQTYMMSAPQGHDIMGLTSQPQAVMSSGPSADLMAASILRMEATGGSGLDNDTLMKYDIFSRQALAVLTL